MRVRRYSSLRVVFKLSLKRGYLFYEMRYLEFVCIVSLYTLTVDDTCGELHNGLFTLLDATTKGDSDDRITHDALAARGCDWFPEAVHGLFPPSWKLSRGKP
jgi:hypothetical protein